MYSICIFFVFFCVFLPKNTRQIQKIQKNWNLTNTKYTKKIRINNFKNTKYKKIQTQNFKNTKYKEKTNSKINQRANPVFTVEIRRQIAKKIQNQPLVFSKPCSSDFVFLGCIFFVFFFVFWNVGRRPFCSHRGQLKSIYLSICKIKNEEIQRDFLNVWT